MRTLLKYFLILTMLSGIVFGNQNLLSQNSSLSNTAKLDTTTLIPDSINLGNVLRVIYKNKPGVFLTNEQELITLAKFQWKEIYKLQAKDFKAEVYKLKIDLNDANRQLDRYKAELADTQFNQLAMRRSVENCKSLLDQKTRENATLNISHDRFRKEARIYKVLTYVLMGVVTYVVISK